MSSQNQNPECPGACSSSPVGLIITSYCICRVGRKKNTQLISLPIVYKHSITEYRLAASSARISLSLAITQAPGASDSLGSGRRTAKHRTHHFTPPFVRAGNESPQDCSRQMLGGMVPIYISARRALFDTHHSFTILINSPIKCQTTILQKPSVPQVN